MLFRDDKDYYLGLGFVIEILKSLKSVLDLSFLTIENNYKLGTIFSDDNPPKLLNFFAVWLLLLISFHSDFLLE